MDEHTGGPAITNRTLFVTSVCLLLTLACILLLALRGEPLVVRTHLERIPLRIGGFQGSVLGFADEVVDELDADIYVFRNYRNEQDDAVSLYIGYYGTQKGGRTGHNPYACLPGSGWGVVETRRVFLQAPYARNKVPVNYILARKGDLYEVVLHWYQSAGTRVLASGIQQNMQRFIGRALRNRNDGAFVRVSVFCGEQEIPRAGETATLFAEQILELLPAYWPEEK